MRILFFLFSLLPFVPYAATASQPNTPDTLATPCDSLPPLPYELRLKLHLDSLITHNPLLETSQLGLMVWDLTADSALYAHNHRQRMRPASTMKLLTAITALDQLGPAHRFTTELRSTGSIIQRTDSTGGTLYGDLLCVGGMDPAFDNGNLRVLVDRLRQAGIDTIRGRILADKSMKDTLLLGEGWCWDDDNPVLSPLLVARKDNFTDRLQHEMTNVGIVILPSQPSSLNSSLSPITVTHPLSYLLQRMMKQSDNLYAESVFYHIALSSGRPATAKNARSNIKKVIQQTGLNPADYYIADGSGLSLYNYVSPELLSAFLRYAWQHDRIRDNLLPTLPVAGVDGTLKDRMKQTPAYQNVKAKTGTLTGISSLAGYCTAPNGHHLCFAIINQGISKTKSGKAFQDQVCAALCGSL